MRIPRSLAAAALAAALSFTSFAGAGDEVAWAAPWSARVAAPLLAQRTAEVSAEKGPLKLNGTVDRVTGDARFAVSLHLPFFGWREIATRKGNLRAPGGLPVPFSIPGITKGAITVHQASRGHLLAQGDASVLGRHYTWDEALG